MTENEFKTLEMLIDRKFDHVYRNDSGQLFAVKGDYKLLLDSECFPSVTIPCPIYQLEQIDKHPINIDHEILKVWIYFLENNKPDIILRAMKKILSEQKKDEEK